MVGFFKGSSQPKGDPVEFWVNEAILEGPRECGCGRREECVPEALSTPQIHTRPQSAFAAATSRPRSPNSCAPTGAPGPACNTAQGCRLQQAAAHWHLPPSDRNPVGHLRHFGHSPADPASASSREPAVTPPDWDGQRGASTLPTHTLLQHRRAWRPGVCSAFQSKLSCSESS